MSLYFVFVLFALFVSILYMLASFGRFDDKLRSSPPGSQGGSDVVWDLAQDTFGPRPGGSSATKALSSTLDSRGRKKSRPRSSSPAASARDRQTDLEQAPEKDLIGPHGLERAAVMGTLPQKFCRMFHPTELLQFAIPAGQQSIVYNVKDRLTSHAKPGKEGADSAECSDRYVSILGKHNNEWAWGARLGNPQVRAVFQHREGGLTLTVTPDPHNPSLSDTPPFEPSESVQIVLGQRGQSRIFPITKTCLAGAPGEAQFSGKLKKQSPGKYQVSREGGEAEFDIQVDRGFGSLSIVDSTGGQFLAKTKPSGGIVEVAVHPSRDAVLILACIVAVLYRSAPP